MKIPTPHLPTQKRTPERLMFLATFSWINHCLAKFHVVLAGIFDFEFEKR
jgi:hypothetical protein